MYDLIDTKLDYLDVNITLLLVSNQGQFYMIMEVEDE
jgi:hypothetical protein